METMKRVLFLFLLLGSVDVFGQRIPRLNFVLTNFLCEEDETDRYNRVGITVLSSRTKELDADPNEALTADMIKHLPKKFDLNMVGYGDVSIGRHRSWQVSKNAARFAAELRTKGVYQNVLDRIMIPWDKIEGSPDVYPRELKKRIYNSVTNLDVDNTQFSALKLDKFVFDSQQGMRVLDNNYVVIFDYKKYTPLTQVYDRRRKVVNRIIQFLTLNLVKYDRDREPDRIDHLYGMKVKGRAYLFKINVLNEFDEVRNFYYKKNFPATAEGMVTEEPNLNMSLVKTRKFSTKVLTYARGREKQAIREAFSRMENNVMHESFGRLENAVPELNIRRTFLNGRELKIELGTKEGIFTNQRFLVYQQVQKSDGHVVSKPVAAVRVRKIADNERRVSDESRVELSKCYQYQGRKIEDGMFMRQFNEIGLEVGYEGLYNKGLAQYYHALKFSYDVSRYLGGAQIRVFAKTVSGIKEGNLKNLVYSGLVDVSEGSNNGLFFITDSLQYQRETQTLSNTPVTYALSTRIPFIGEVGFSYEYNYLKNFFLRGELGAMGYYIGLPNGSNLVVGNSSSYSTLSELKLNGLLGRLNVGYFLSPSISVYGGVGLSILRVKATGNFETAVKGNNLINQNISFGLKFNL
jgi:hypothetical protein